MKLMIGRIFKPFFIWLNDFVHRPHRVFLLCLVIAFTSLVLEGSLLRLWRLHRNSSDIDQRISKITLQSEQLKLNLKKASDLNFIELQARERFDLASEGDLIFVFSNEGEDLAQNQGGEE